MSDGAAPPLRLESVGRRYRTEAGELPILVAADLTRRGKPPLVLTSGAIIGSAASSALFDQTYDDYRSRLARVYGGTGPSESAS